MNQQGFYYWRGRVLPLLWDLQRGFCVRVPKDLVDTWRRDVKAGRIKLN
jgi:hypothetical protein